MNIPLVAAAGLAAGLALAPFAEARDIAMLAPLAVATVIDIRTRRIPNWLTAGAAAFALASAGWDGLPASALGAVIAGVAGLVLAIAARGGFGMGDVKLMAFAGAAVGAGAALPFLVLMALAGGAIAVAAMLFSGAGRRATIPYGPAIALGCAATLLFA